ncbi:acetyl-CoA carboxylase biotin carboxyl carrier protein [Novosphingobium lentum]|uniref:acetyl-CoA carboxylase biotin carboxyl carrier protein n=1 Tax=Novosphingobium lentum TaxID=145287 RepID=UPI000A022E93|nr:biotin/lipoyl-containing protein [Novosphingobium lentum]
MSEADLPLSADDVAEIVAILEGSGYREVDIATRRFRLRIAPGDGTGDGAGFTQEWEWAGSAPAKADVVAEGIADDPAAIGAPLPGTFYRAPQPGAPPFVEPGDTVAAETVIGIIETMKLMNPVHAGRAGTIGAFVAENGAMVAKGETLAQFS